MKLYRSLAVLILIPMIVGMTSCAPTEARGISPQMTAAPQSSTPTLVHAASTPIPVAATPIPATPTSQPVKGKFVFSKMLPSPDYKEWVSEDNQRNMTGIEQEWNCTTDDSRINGLVVLGINLKVQSTTEIGGIFGQVWGTIKIINSGGRWEGSWKGQREPSGYSTYQAELQGYGDYQNLSIKMDWVRADPSDTAPITINGEIK